MKTRQPLSHSSSTPTSRKPSFKILTAISTTKFPVYKVRSESDKSVQAMKVYYYEKDQPSKHFENESRFARLSHTNIIHMTKKEFKETAIMDYKNQTFSYIMMELAPYGDLATLVLEKNLPMDEKFVRTYFRQLIDGVQYLHDSQIYHLDLKLDNMLIGHEYLLKIADFDGSYKTGDSTVIGNGTTNYRAPELKDRCFRNAAAADIYSCGIILFILMTKNFPYAERITGTEVDKLWNLMLEGDQNFWDLHSKNTQSTKNFSESFKKLFMWMTKGNPNERATLREIKSSPWYVGDVYSKSEMMTLMAKYLAPKEKKVKN